MSREGLAVDLRTYGEDELADQIAALPERKMTRIGERAYHYLYSDKYAKPSGDSPYLGWACAMAAVEVVEGRKRDLKWKRRKLKGIYPGC